MCVKISGGGFKYCVCKEVSVLFSVFRVRFFFIFCLGLVVF